MKSSVYEDVPNMDDVESEDKAYSSSFNCLKCITNRNENVNCDTVCKKKINI